MKLEKKKRMMSDQKRTNKEGDKSYYNIIKYFMVRLTYTYI